MNNDDFNDELERLYRQRRKSVTAPQITVTKNIAKTSTVRKFSSIILLAVGSSFGVLAIVSHLATPSTPEQMARNANQQFIEIEPVVSSTEDVAANLTPKLREIKEIPPVPKSNAPATANIIAIDTTTIASPELSDSLDINVVLQDDARRVLRKVMPEYSTPLQSTSEVATVVLTYQVRSDGTIANIAVEQSNATQALNVEAKRALSNWLYEKSADSQLTNTKKVVFEFKAR
jgi:TonB family protein